MVRKAFLRLMIVALAITTRLAQGTTNPEASKVEFFHYCMNVIKKEPWIPKSKNASPYCLELSPHLVTFESQNFFKIFHLIEFCGTCINCTVCL